MAAKTVARDLHFNFLEEIVVEAKKIAVSTQAIGTAEWTPAQNIQHVAMVLRASIEGFPGAPPLPIRLIGPLFKQRFLNRSFNPGIKLPKSLASFHPDASVTGQEAVEMLEKLTVKARDQGYIPASPLFGKLSTQQWEQLHCRHAEMHFGMIRLTPAHDTPAPRMEAAAQ